MMDTFILAPNAFDVSINSFLDHYFRNDKVVVIPGDLVIDVNGIVDLPLDFYIHGDLIVLGNINCHDIKVCGDILGNGDIDCTETAVGGAVIGPKINTNGYSLYTGMLLEYDSSKESQS